MRLGHNSSSGSKEGFHPDVDLFRALLVAMEHRQLVDQHRSQSETRSVHFPFGGNLPMHIENSLEVLVEVLVGHATQFVEDPPDLHTVIGMRVGSSARSDQKTLPLRAGLLHVWSVVMSVSEHEARLIGQLLDQKRSYGVVRRIGR